MLTADRSADSAVKIVDRSTIAVLVPCYNEETAIGKVVGDFRAALPEATVYVYDNNSADRTAAVAEQAGAVVRHERHQGKGRVARRMFTDIDADIYVLVDGDATYDAPSARAMIEKLVRERLDMVCAIRVDREQAAYRRHRFGNRLLTGFVSHMFGRSFTDMLSGYRVFTRRFVKSFPALSGGFEIETELTVHALELELPVDEMRAVLLAAPGFGIEAQHLEVRRAHPAHGVPALSRRAPAGAVYGARRLARDRLGRTRGADHRHLLRARRSAAAPHRGALDRADAARFAIRYLRAHSRHRDAGPPRTEAFGLPVSARAGRGTAAERPMIFR
jgi:glycosyltransferase involved in cell wall biosynthesis